MKDLKSRLERIAIDVSNLRNFNYADEYGLTERNVGKMIDGFIQDFPGAFLDSRSTSMLEFYPADLTQVNQEKLAEREKEVKKLYCLLKSDDSYRRLLKAYRSGDQDKIKQTLPGVFHNPRMADIFDGSEIRCLFHGVRVPEEIDAEDYLKLCLKIQKEGIRNSPYGLHMNMDQTIRPVFATPDKNKAHGILFFSFRPQGYTVELDKSLQEARIYVPRLKVPMEINVRSADTLHSYSPDEVGIDENKASKFIEELERGLKRKKIPFKNLGIPKN